jgi:transglutaminase-like putative cysteine protease
MKEYLGPGRFIDSNHPRIVEFAHARAKGRSDRDQAIALYYAVRDEVRYHPFQNYTIDDTYTA